MTGCGSPMPSPPAGDDTDTDTLRRQAACLLALQEAACDRRRLADDLDRLHGSLSWRLTAPLRRLRAWLFPPTPAAPVLAPAHPGDADTLEDPTTLLRRQLGLDARALPAQAPRLYVDVTELACEDLVGGIQRTTRRILAEWLLAPPQGLRVEPVRLAADGRYVHARAHLARMLGLAHAQAGADVAVTARAGDRFVGLDLVRDHVPQARTALAALREQGVVIGVVLYDLLPMQHPEWFPEGIATRFADWVQAVAEPADCLLCISRSVAAQATTTLALPPMARPRIVDFPLGSDLEALTPAHLRLPARQDGWLRWLMVGTVEPRKGHAQALDAFERLWSDGHAVELVIVGRPGWRVEALLDRLAVHPQRGRRLHWCDAADDADLLAAYRDADVLLAASSGEGYGLPLVEAARQGLPILARDLPVFREVAGAGADYFQAGDGAELAQAMQAWMLRREQGAVADPGGVRQCDWRDSAAALAAELMRA